MPDFDTRYNDGTYMETTQDWHEGDAEWKAGHIARIIEKISPTPDTICDVGCGVGGVLFHLQQLLSPSIAYTGFDISAEAINIASSRTTGNLVYKNANILEESTKIFDVLMLIDVFEHVDDYLGFLSDIRDRAKYFVFHIPLDLSALSVLREWPVIRRRHNVGHIHYFTKATALATLKDCGYETLHCFYTPSGFQPPDKSLKAMVRNAPNKILFRVRPDYTARLMGGYSLMVLAKARASSDTG